LQYSEQLGGTGLLSRKRLLFVSTSLGEGGAEKLAALLLQYLSRDKFEPILAVFRERFDYYMPEDVPVICFHKKGTYDLPWLIWQLARVYEKEKPNTVVSFDVNLTPIIAKKLARTKPRLLLSVQNQTSIRVRQDFLSHIKSSWAIPHLYPEADRIICCSRGVADDLVTQFRIPHQKIRVVYNPVDIEYVLSLAEEEVNHPHFASKEMPVIIAMGRLAVQKGYPYLLTAFAQVVSKFPCRLVILGEGKERDSLAKLVRRLGIERQVDFLGFQKNPFKYLAHSDIFVLSSLWEGFALVILEAMTCGIPVISTRCPSGPDEIITDGVNGLLVPVADEKALAEAMLRLLEDKELSAKLAQAGRKRVEDFAVERFLKEYKTLF